MLKKAQKKDLHITSLNWALQINFSYRNNRIHPHREGLYPYQDLKD